MAIVIDRNSGAVTSTMELSPEQTQDAWERILRAFLAAHPETLTDE